MLVLMLLFAVRLGAQTPVKPLSVSIAPPDNTVMVTQTVNTVTVTVKNFGDFTNLTVELEPPWGPQSVPDDGTPPDKKSGDGIFSLAFTVPAFPGGTNVTLTFLTSGQDLSATNDTGELDPTAIAFATNSVNYIIVPRPANDNFTNAFKLAPEGALLTATNNYASLESGEPAHAGVTAGDASVWWDWSPAVSTNVLIDTAGSAFLPVLAVYSGSALTGLKPVAASTGDRLKGQRANVNFNAQAGITYRIAVSGFDTNGVGDIRLRVAPGWLPDGLPPVVNILTPASETLVSDPMLAVTGYAKDAEPFPSGVSNVVLQVNGGPPQAVAGLADWTAQLSLPPGTNIITALATDYAGNVSAPHTIVVRYMDPTNDNFESAILLTQLAGIVKAVNGRATTEPGEPFHGGNEGGHSIWYSFLAPLDGQFFATTTNSDFDTLMGLYTGTNVADLTVVAENDDAFPHSGFSQITADLKGGQLYHLAIDGFGGDTGNIDLQYAFTTTATFFSLNVPSALGGTVAPDPGLYVAGSTQIVTALPARDFVFTGWSGSVVSQQNPIRLVMDQNYTLYPSFRVISFTDGFESGTFTNLAWNFGGQSPWLIESQQTASGLYAAQAGPTGDGKSSSLILQTTLLAGTGSFAVRTSSEPGWDFLEFYLNGQMLQRWSGDIQWQTFQFPVPAGLNHLEWRYAKDANWSAGLDTAFIDNLYLPLPDSAIAAQLSISAVPGAAGSYQLIVEGRPGRTYVLETAPDLSAWVPVFTNTPVSGTFPWTDPAPGAQGRRFYRAVLP